MEIFNDFFVSFEVVQGPKILYITKNKIGSVIFFPSPNNFFVKKPSPCFIFDNRKVDLSDEILKFSTYTDIPIIDIQNLCISIWSEEIGF